MLGTEHTNNERDPVKLQEAHIPTGDTDAVTDTQNRSTQAAGSAKEERQRGLGEKTPVAPDCEIPLRDGHWSRHLRPLILAKVGGSGVGVRENIPKLS